MSGAAGSGLQSEVGLYSYQSGINPIVNPYLCLPTHGKCLNLFSEITWNNRLVVDSSSLKPFFVGSTYQWN
jgi:hypothetical protein